MVLWKAVGRERLVTSSVSGSVVVCVEVVAAWAMVPQAVRRMDNRKSKGNDFISII